MAAADPAEEPSCVDIFDLWRQSAASIHRPASAGICLRQGNESTLIRDVLKWRAIREQLRPGQRARPTDIYAIRN